MDQITDTAAKRWTSNLTPRRLLDPKRRKPLLIGAGVLIALIAGFMIFKPEKAPEYRTEAVRRTTLTTSISSTGTLQPLESVQVGSEVSGLVKSVLVDFNSQVKKGQVLAIIDNSNFRNAVQQSEASLSSAQAQLRVAQSDYDRQKRLVAADLVTEKVAENSNSARAQAAASVKTAAARLATDRSNLIKTEIKAPIDGIVINRTIDPGNTVNASQSVPNLFIIANDLSRLKLRVLVDEADIGNVREGQKVTFTVDAFPDDNFEGVVDSVRKQSITTSNVVSYEVIALANNPGRKLLPGMTANVDIVLEEHPDVLVAPVAGGRWKPADAKPAAQNASANGGNGGNGGQRERGQGGGQGGGRGFGGGQGGGPGGQAMLDRLNTELGLDAAQKTKVEAIVQASRPQMQAAFQAGDDRQARQAALRKVNEQMYADIGKVLKPEQQPKLAALREEMGQRGGRGGGAEGAPRPQPRTLYLLRDGKPTPIQVTTTANDGTNMSVDGPVKEGDLVVIGGGPVAKGAAQQRQGQANVGFGGPGGGFGGAPGGFGGGAGGGRR